MTRRVRALITAARRLRQSQRASVADGPPPISLGEAHALLDQALEQARQAPAVPPR
jgi:hypothetical protein